MNEPRLDKFLWSVRLYKTRSDAAEAVRTNHVRVNDATTKPSREVRIGDKITLRRGPVTYTYRVLQLLQSRVGAPLVPEYIEDLTPPPPPQETSFIFRERGAGRPTKKERRELERIFE